MRAAQLCGQLAHAHRRDGLAAAIRYAALPHSQPLPSRRRVTITPRVGNTGVAAHPAGSARRIRLHSKGVPPLPERIMDEQPPDEWLADP